MLSVAQTIQRQIKLYVNDEFKNMLKMSWPNLLHYPGIFLEEVRKTTINFVRIANLRFEIRTWDLPNINSSDSHSTTMFGRSAILTRGKRLRLHVIGDETKKLHSCVAL
jgi:hypothetical protein